MRESETLTESSVHIVCPSCGAVNRVPAARPAEEAKCGHCHRPMFTGAPVAVDDEDRFERHVRRNDIPVVVDFWAPWCAPCRAMAPALERAAAELQPRYRVLKVDTEAAPGLATRYGIRSIPTLMRFAGGRPVAHAAGALDQQGIVSWARRHDPRK